MERGSCSAVPARLFLLRAKNALARGAAVVPKLAISQNGGTLGTTRFRVAKGPGMEGTRLCRCVACVATKSSISQIRGCLVATRFWVARPPSRRRAVALRRAARGWEPRGELPAASGQRAHRSRAEEGLRKQSRGQRDRPVAGRWSAEGSRRAERSRLPSCQRASERRGAKSAGAGPRGHVFTCPFTCVIVADAARQVKQFLETRAVSGGGDWSYYAVGRLIFAWFAFERPTGFPHLRIAVGRLGRPVTAPCTGIYWNGRLRRIDSMGTHVLVVARTPLVDLCHPYHDGHLYRAAGTVSPTRPSDLGLATTWCRE